MHVRGNPCTLRVPSSSRPAASLELIRWILTYVIAKPKREKRIGKVCYRTLTAIL